MWMHECITLNYNTDKEMIDDQQDYSGTLNLEQSDILLSNRHAIPKLKMISTTYPVIISIRLYFIV